MSSVDMLDYWWNHTGYPVCPYSVSQPIRESKPIKSFEDLYNQQIKYQEKITGRLSGSLPNDNIEQFAMQSLMLIEEIGELLKEDKRWKNIRKDRYEPKLKQEEFADLFIVLMNMCIYSGLTYDNIYDIINAKILKNFGR